MANKDDGGPAFPQRRIYRCSQGIDHEVSETGLSLRDWFAGQALAGIASMSGDGFGLSPEDEASWAYQRADAMLRARSNGEG